MRSVEAIFGGVLALIVVGAAIFMLAGGNWGGGGSVPPTDGVVITPPPSTGSGDSATNAALCQCFDQAFDLAGKNVDVMSSQYRTGFESCRGVLGPKGGDAWTAGWNARLSSNSFLSSCGSWLKRS